MKYKIENYKRFRNLYYIFLMIMTLVLIINIYNDFEKTMNFRKQENLDSVKNVTEDIKSFIDNEIYLNRIFARAYLDSVNSDRKIQDYEKTFYNEEVLYNLGFIKRDGIVEYYPNSFYDYINSDDMCEVIHTAKKNNKTFVSDVIKFKNDRFGIVILTPVFNRKDQYMGCVFRTINISYIDKNIIPHKTGDQVNDYFAVNSIGEWIFCNTNPDIIGSKYYEYIDKNKNTEVYFNYFKMAKGEEFTSDNHLILPGLYKNYDITSDKRILSCSPVIINGKPLMSVGLSLSKDKFQDIYQIAMLRITILLLAFLLFIFIGYKLRRENIEYEQQKLILEEQLKNTKLIKKLNEQVDITQFELIKTLIKLMEMKDEYTAGHSERVEQYAAGLAKSLRYDEEKLKTLEYAAYLHDIGKMQIPLSILNKNDKLTSHEYDIIKQHTNIGYKILKEVGFLNEVSEVVLHHHERVDGKGYPDGITGNNLNEMCKILAVCDSYDAMTSNRIYRKKLRPEDALNELKKNSGTQFDKYIVDKFNEYITKCFYNENIIKAG